MPRYDPLLWGGCVLYIARGFHHKASGTGKEPPKDGGVNSIMVGEGNNFARVTIQQTDVDVEHPCFSYKNIHRSIGDSGDSPRV